MTLQAIARAKAVLSKQDWPYHNESNSKDFDLTLRNIIRQLFPNGIR